ncbi:MAG: hypothetical protein AYK18_02770 [Theionarchaea archaeon DG-70]|nr:MAG: hypothetical protein AYK18_02770 [Theionarchaea archaeon DG-70]
MRFGKKGQGAGLVIAIIIIMVILSAISFISMNAFITGGESYPQAWENWADQTFEEQDQPWRMISLFFLPFFLYFGLIFLSLTMVFGGIGRTGYYVRYSDVKKPVTIICFVIAMMMLPSPFTFTLSSFFIVLSPILSVIIFVMIMIGGVFGFYLFYGLARKAHETFPKGRGEREEPVTERPLPAEAREIEETEDVGKNTDKLLENIENFFTKTDIWGSVDKQVKGLEDSGVKDIKEFLKKDESEQRRILEEAGKLKSEEIDEFISVSGNLKKNIGECAVVINKYYNQAQRLKREIMSLKGIDAGARQDAINYLEELQGGLVNELKRLQQPRHGKLVDTAFIGTTKKTRTAFREWFATGIKKEKEKKGTKKSKAKQTAEKLEKKMKNE